MHKTYIARKIIYLDKIDSTNSFLKNHFENGLLVYTKHQTSGRGQQNNTWESEAGKNLLLSFGISPVFLDASKQFYLSKSVSLAVYDLVSTYAKDVKIKWPNDIYVSDKKIAGILIENSLRGSQISSSTVGIGLNINQSKFPESLINPVSLSQLCGKQYDIKQILSELISFLNCRYEELVSNNYKNLTSEYLKHLYGYKQERNFLISGQIVQAAITGVEENGRLILQFKNGNLKSFAFKEIQFI